MRYLLLFTLFFTLTNCNNTTEMKNKTTDNSPIVFVGTYTQNLGFVNGKAAGIYTCRMDAATGALTVIDSAAMANPSFVTVSPDKKFLYAVSEGGGKPNEPFGGVASFKIGDNGHLTPLNSVSSYGVAPCHISTDKTGKIVFVANYVNGSVESYGVKPDGSLTDAIQKLQYAGKDPFAHQMFTTPDNRFAVVVNKGLDTVFVYKFETDGKFTEVHKAGTVKGAGPRHLSFNTALLNEKGVMPAYVLNENNSTVDAFYFDTHIGTLTNFQTINNLPPDFKGVNTGAEIKVHPSGKFLYASNRGHNSIAVYQLDTSGKMTFVEHVSTQGAVPRFFMITDDGKMLLVANQNSDNIVAFKIDASTGKLTQTADSKIFTPVCIAKY